MPKIRLGTRGSPLALAQANDVRRRLIATGLAPDAVTIEIFKTSGDRIQDRPLSEAGGKGLFTKELEEALLDRRIDLAVHSMKDVATRLPDGLVIAAILEREDVRDAFVSLTCRRLADLPANALFGTSSIRRQAQLLRLRPDLRMTQFRGNVQTRLKKLADGVAVATLLATAGLNRLDMADRIAEHIPADVLLPAPAQGAVGIEIRAGDSHAERAVAPLRHPPTAIAVAAERAFLAVLDGSCRTPIAALATLASDGRTIAFRGEVLRPDGGAHVTVARSAAADHADAARAGADAARELLARGGAALLAGSA